MTTKLILIALAVTLLFAGGYYVHTLMAENQELKGELKIANMKDSLTQKEIPRIVKAALDSAKVREDSSRVVNNEMQDKQNYNVYTKENKKIETNSFNVNAVNLHDKIRNLPTYEQTDIR